MHEHLQSISPFPPKKKKKALIFARLSMVSYLKWYKNYGLKSVMKICVKNTYNSKNVFDNIFQIIYFKMLKNIIVCLGCVCVFFIYKKWWLFV